MKKFFATILSLCMVLSTSTIAFAAEAPVTEATSITAETRNIDYYTYPDQLLDGTKTVTVTPGSGEALKMHVYLSSGSLTVWVKPSSSSVWTQITTWNTIGHHYCDLVSNTDGGSYQVKVFGAASWFEGGIYSGN